jgi:hypothetical protein
VLADRAANIVHLHAAHRLVPDPHWCLRLYRASRPDFPLDISTV